MGLMLAAGLAVHEHATPRAQSSAYDPSLFSALQWRNIGPNRGGRSLAAAGSPGRPLEYYFGAVGGGLWKTTDAGTTWKPVTDGQIKSSSVGAIAISESNPDIVYIGMGEVALRGNIMQGDGVYRSTDAGKTWTHMGLADSQAISRIRVHPSNPDLVFVAAFGHPAAPNKERGIFRSKDGGQSWEHVLFRDEKTGAADLILDRNNPNVLYASLWEAYRVTYQMSSGGPGSGLFKSTDGGSTWTEITRNQGLPSDVVGKIGVSVSGADGNRVYAIIENENGGVFSSDDGGTTWTRVSDDRRLRQRAFYYSRLYADPKERDTLYVLNTGFYKSTDGGKTYSTIRVPHGDNHDLWIDPNDPKRMINSNDGGGNVSFNGGETWTEQDYPTAQLYHIITTKDVPYHACGAQQDNTTLCVPSDGGGLRDPRATAGEWLYPVGGGESGYIAPHPKNPNLFYAGSQGALLTRYDRSTSHIRDVQVYPRFFSGEPSSALKERWQWTFPIVFSPHDPNVIYASSQHLWRTTNEGQSWERISPDLTKADPKTLGQSGGPITGDMNGPEVFATIFAIAPSPLEHATIWTGSDDGLIYVTRDEGKNWQHVTPPDLPELSRVSIVDASPHKAGTAYFAAKRYLLDDRAPYIYRTHDYGKTWKKIVNGIDSADYPHVVREDPKRAGLLYAGTEHGVWVSFGDGERWQSLRLNLPDTQVSDLVVEENDLVIGTHGRSIYVLDDISALRQAAPEMSNQVLHLFQPRTAARGLSVAPIDYYLKSESDKVVVEILDAKGQVIRTFTGVPEDDKRKPGEADFGGPAGPEPPPRKAGLNRFRWDLRYPGATTFEGMILWSARADLGPFAPPGDYQVRVTANGASETQPYKIVKDPRLTLFTDADLLKQFDLSMQVRDRTSEANEAVILIRDLKAQVADRLQKLGAQKPPAIIAAADSLTSKASQIEEALYQVKNQSNQDPLNFPIKLNNRIASLRRSIDTGHAPPTEGAQQVLTELTAELRTELSKLDGVLSQELAAFNKLIAGRRLAPVKPESKKPFDSRSDAQGKR